MDIRSLLQPLEPAWQRIIDGRLAAMRAPPTTDVAKLAPRIAQLSQAYNEGIAEGRQTQLPLEARLAFSFPRDVPKGAGAVRELVASGALALPPARDRPLRIVDLGAGLGAMTWGVARALGRMFGRELGVEALLIDEDGEALKVAEALLIDVRHHPDLQHLLPVDLAFTTRTLDVRAAVRDLRGAAPADVVILGQVLSELDLRVDARRRIEAHAELVADILSSLVAPNGSLVIVEPALRDRTRHLHAVRDRVLAGAAGAHGPATVFAPCLHQAACPALAVEGEWCHEDLRIDLPDWVVPLARSAGLRWQGLTFSYLVLRKDGRTLMRPGEETRAIRFRAISAPLRTKGKQELVTCAENGERARVRLLDRDAKAVAVEGTSFEDLQRGDIVTLRSRADATPPVDERGRIAPSAAIDVASFPR